MASGRAERKGGQASNMSIYSRDGNDRQCQKGGPLWHQVLSTSSSYLARAADHFAAPKVVVGWRPARLLPKRYIARDDWTRTIGQAGLAARNKRLPPIPSAAKEEIEREVAVGTFAGSKGMGKGVSKGFANAWASRLGLGDGRTLDRH